MLCILYDGMLTSISSFYSHNTSADCDQGRSSSRENKLPQNHLDCTFYHPLRFSKVCHLQTCCPLDSFISVQWLSSSSPELLRPKEIHPIISFRFMLRLLYTDSMSVTSESWNSATWKTKVSLYTGFGCPRRIEVLHLDISCPIEFSSVSLTYVSAKEVTLWNVRYLGTEDLRNEEQGYGVYQGGWTQLSLDTWEDDK